MAYRTEQFLDGSVVKMIVSVTYGMHCHDAQIMPIENILMEGEN